MTNLLKKLVKLTHSNPNAKPAKRRPTREEVRAQMLKQIIV